MGSGIIIRTSDMINSEMRKSNKTVPESPDLDKSPDSKGAATGSEQGNDSEGEFLIGTISL
jgi:hypothetical protein